MLQAACRPVKKRRATRPTRGSHRRRLEDKKQQSVKKQGRRGIDRPD
jgi:ribosome-associated protein